MMAYTEKEKALVILGKGASESNYSMEEILENWEDYLEYCGESGENADFLGTAEFIADMAREELL